MRSKISFSAVIFIIILSFSVIPPVQSQSTLKPKKILVLFPFYETRDWDYEFNTGFFSRIKDFNDFEISISLEYLKTGLIPETITVEETVANLKRMKEVQNPDLIISIFPSVHAFLAEYGEAIFPGVPKIFVPTIPEQEEELLRLPDAFIIRSSSEYAIETSLKNLKTILPKLEHLIITCGSGNDDLYYLNLFNELLAKADLTSDLSYHIGTPIPELLSRISDLQDNTAIFYLPFNRDNENMPYKTSNIFPEFAEAADAPIFSFHDTPFGLGIVGGVMTSASSYGKEAAEAAVKVLLNQTEPETLDVTFYAGKYDWRQLKRWGIDEDNLPEGSEIAFKTVTFSQRYRTQIILVISLIIAETFLLIILFFNLKKRRRIEKLLITKDELLNRSQKTATLGGWDLELETNKLTYTKEMLNIFELGSSEIITTENVLGYLSAEDFPALQEAIKTAVNDAAPYEIEIRIITAKGKRRWVSVQGYGIRKDGKTIAISGTLQDITNRKLAEIELQESVKEKEVLLKEVHHRVKNNLAIMSSLLALQRDTIADESVKSLLLNSQNRISSMAIIHEQLYEKDNLQSLDFAEYARQLVDYIITSYGGKMSRVITNLDIIEQEMVIDSLVPLGIMLNEIVSNSLKHSFSDIDNPQIGISLKNSEDGELILSVKDNGTGLPDDSILSQKNTIGFLLIKNLVNQIKGRLEIVRENGTEFIIYFKNQI